MSLEQGIWWKNCYVAYFTAIIEYCISGYIMIWKLTTISDAAMWTVIPQNSPFEESIQWKPTSEGNLGLNLSLIMGYLDVIFVLSPN